MQYLLSLPIEDFGSVLSSLWESFKEQFATDSDKSVIKKWYLCEGDKKKFFELS